MTNAVLSTTSPLTITVGQSVPLNLAVSDTGTAFNSITGTATFSDGATVLGTASQIEISLCWFSATGLAPGSHQLTAVYGGGSGNAASPPSNTITIMVSAPQSQTISFAPLTNVTLGVSPFTVSATASSGLTVTFASNTLSVCTVNVATVTILAAGSCSITASQAGNGSFAAATPVTQAFTVLQTQTITFAPLSNVTIGVMPFGTVSAAADLKSHGYKVCFEYDIRLHRKCRYRDDSDR